jgi:hypothetical protein
MSSTEAVNRSTGHSSIPWSQKAPPTAPNVSTSCRLMRVACQASVCSETRSAASPNHAAVRVASRIPVSSPS